MASVCRHIHYCDACGRPWNCVRWACNEEDDLTCEQCITQAAVQMDLPLSPNPCSAPDWLNEHTPPERRPLKRVPFKKIVFIFAFTIPSTIIPSQICTAKENRFANVDEAQGASLVTPAQEVSCNAASLRRLKGQSLQVRLCKDGLIIEKSPKRFFRDRAKDNAEGETNEELDSIPSYIPMTSISAVIEEVAPQKPVQIAIHWTLTEMQPDNLMNEAADAGEGAPGIVAVPIVLGTAAIVMAPFQGATTHRYSVRVLWVDHGQLRSTRLDLSSKDAGSLSNQVATRIGQDLIQVRFDKDQQRQQWILASFPSWVSLGPLTSRGGTFRFLTIKCSDGTNLIYVFPNESKFLQDALLVVKAESEPLGAAKPWKVKLGRNSEGISCVKEVDTDAERLRVDGCPVP